MTDKLGMSINQVIVYACNPRLAKWKQKGQKFQVPLAYVWRLESTKLYQILSLNGGRMQKGSRRSIFMLQPWAVYKRSGFRLRETQIQDQLTWPMKGFQIHTEMQRFNDMLGGPMESHVLKVTHDLWNMNCKLVLHGRLLYFLQ